METKIFGREPAAVMAVVGGLFMFLASIGFDWLNAGQAAAITGVVSAMVLAYTTRPIAPGVLTGLITAAVGLLAAYAIELPDEQVVLFTDLALAGFALITREQVSPQPTIITNA